MNLRKRWPYFCDALGLVVGAMLFYVIAVCLFCIGG